MQKLKSIYSLFLFCSLVLPFCIITIWFQAHIFQSQKSAASFLVKGHHEEALTTLKFSIADAENLLEWEHDKEFEYNSEMYDVIEVEFYADSIAYLCYHDKKETILKRDYESFIADFLTKRQPTDQQRQYTIDFLKTLYFADDHSSSKIVNNSKDKREMNDCLSTNSDFIFSPPSPPPRFYS